MPARFIESNTCQDGCGIIKTADKVEGAPVYRCPGCDSRWIELNERSSVKDPKKKVGIPKLRR
ncbi:hypothetical protein ACTQ49_10230 [Luteococcus sp. Sow4_B9]|uniref:hypothetical protein n=1 Tax=Luteococcus sp. Sow4_B9 TaxID=3438792 RepID=UPI003F971659